VKYRNLNFHTYIELHYRLIHLEKSSNTQFYQLTNPSDETCHLPKISWLAFAISYFREAIYIPSCCVSVRCLLQHTAFLTHCTAYSY